MKFNSSSTKKLEINDLKGEFISIVENDCPFDYIFHQLIRKIMNKHEIPHHAILFNEKSIYISIRVKY